MVVDNTKLVMVKSKFKKYFNWIIIILVFAWSWKGAEIRPLELMNNSDNMITLLKDFFPPDFTEWESYSEDMIVTVQIALWGTFLSAIVAVPFAVLSSENLFPPMIVYVVRRLMDITRSINEIVLAMIFVAAIGLGPFAGVLAIFFHTTGVFAKLFSESVEAIDMRCVEGVRSVGATKMQEILYGVIPQVIPLWLSYILYRFESNVRSAAVLGIVGAGGIGTAIYETLSGFALQQTAAILIIIVISVNVIDLISNNIRKKFI